MSYKVYANGAISKGTTNVRARISQQPNGKFLTTRMIASYAGIDTGLDLNIDIETAYGQKDLDAVVGALLEGADLPAGWTMGARKDGTPRVIRA
ncbi:hypothetical protein [Niveispirillum sp.]|uniref:hypothetical protein n=1 Tax=Niveispirillum sp. TaxID=1917217 RepID=UPI001B64570B|nr:hypothetical protein [Niveispirillum sp.]MBP7338827.1 hypothetical protein [Niveispirillum sp.]